MFSSEIFSPGDRVRVKKNHRRMAGWKGLIKYTNQVKYGIQFDKTPSLNIMMKHDSIEKI